MDSAGLKISRTITWIAAVTGLATALIIPGLYFYIAKTYENANLQDRLEIQAEAVSQFIYARPGYWQFDLGNLEEIIMQGPTDSTGFLVRSNDAGLVYETQATIHPPLERRRASLYDGYSVVGSIEAVVSRHGMYLNTLFAAMVGIALGIAGFLALRILPFRTLERTSRELLESQKRFKDYAESALDWMWEIDADLRYVYFSDGFYERFNITEESMIGKSRLDFAFDETDETWGDHIEDLENRRPFRGFVYKSMMPNGDVKFLDVSGWPQFDEDGAFTGYRGTGTDITQRVKLEEQLMHSQKMDALGKLTSGVAHEFNNLLTAIGGFAHMSMRKPGNMEHVERCIEEIIKASDQAATLTGEMLAFGRKQDLLRTDVNLPPLIEKTRTMLNSLIGENINLSFDGCSCQKNLMIRADGNLLKQALTNLVINASHAMPEGGDLGIECGDKKLDDRYQVEFPDSAPGQYGFIRVSDTGTGMDEKTRRRIFEPFFTTKDTGDGTGLGLAMVYGMIVNSQGVIEVDSTPGKGTTFTLYFPVAEKKEEKDTVAECKGCDVPEEPSISGTVLVAEDTESIRDLTRITLEDIGLTVLMAENADTAEKLYSDNANHIDMLLTDIAMPGQNGIELARGLKERQSDLKVIFMSGHAGLQKLDKDSSLGKCRTLRKPFAPDRLGAVVSDLLSA